jgi:hypothetical protein
MKKIIRLTESDLTRLVKRVIREMDEDSMKHIVWDIKAMNCSGMRENKSGQVDVNYNEYVFKAYSVNYNFLRIVNGVAAPLFNSSF